jgi:decaprenyl-phosphate phosphoribosyltransferase
VTVTEVSIRTGLDGRELLRALRPRQWVKNLLVFAAPLAAGDLGHPVVLALSLAAFVAFTAAAAGGYLLNDVFDLAADRLHPDKRNRPLAAGTISVRVAIASAVGCLVVAATIAALIDDELFLTLVVYSVLTLGYAVRIKRVPGLEVLVVASGFVLRPLAGSFATNVAPSRWFLAVCCLAALAITVGKRLVELVRLGPAAAAHRDALGHYTIAALRRVQLVTISLMALAYVGWALTRPSAMARKLDLVSLLPVLAAFISVAVLNRRGQGGAPEQLILSNRLLQLLVLTWLVLFVAGVASA